MKNRFDTTSAALAASTSPGPGKPSSTVPTTQPMVLASSKAFFFARRSAYAPTSGDIRRTSALEIASTQVHTEVG